MNFSLPPRTWFNHLILHITDRCDLRCKTCFVTKGGLDITFAQTREIAQKIGKVQWLDIGGGEPFLHPDLVSLCSCFKTRSITIPTNGQRTEAIVATTRTLRRQFPGELTIGVSLDGPEAINDAIRGDGSFKNALETFKALQRLDGVIVKISTVVSNKNIDALLPFLHYVRTLNPAYHSVLLLRGKPADTDVTLPDLAVLRAHTPEILAILRSYPYAHRFNFMLRRLKASYQRYLWNICLETLAHGQCYVPCKAPRYHKVIYPNGDVAMCELMPPAGNIFSDSMTDINANLIAMLQEYEKKHGPCYCTHNCNLGENIMTDPRSVFRVLTGKTDV